MKQFMIRDNKTVFNQVEQPAVVFDKESGTLLYIGEREVMQEKFEQYNAVYRASGFVDMAEALVLMDLPHDQDVIDKVFQITGYVKKLYEEALAS